MFNPKLKDEQYFHGFPSQCIWLKINGSWPLKDDVEDTSEHRLNFRCGHRFFAYFYRFWSCYVIFAVGITIYFQTAFLIHTFGDIIMTTENCCTTFMGFLNFVRLLHLRLHQQQFKDVIAHFVTDIWIVKNTHPNIERKCERNMRTFRIMTILLSCLIAMYCVLPIVELFVSIGLDSTEKPFPYKMIFPFNAQLGWRYPFTYCFTALAGISVVTTLFAEDSIFGFFLTYTCGQFLLLHESIDALVQNSYESVLKTIGEESAENWHFQHEYLRNLKKIARQHEKLIRFSKSLENFFGPILLINFMISSILICMVGFQLVTGKDMFIGDYVKFIVYITSSLSQLYVLCWNGDLLIQYSLETAKHLFACKWEGGKFSREEITPKNYWKDIQQKIFTKSKLKSVNNYVPADKEFRQNLEFMILCSQRPVKITALKFSTVSLESFTAILSTSMSYFTLLQTVYNENQNN